MPKDWCGPKERAAIASMAADGCTAQQIGAALGWHRETIVRAARRKGIVLRQGGRPNLSRRLAVIECVRAGATDCGQIARMMGARGREYPLRWVRELVESGILVRTGRTKGTVLRVAEWWEKESAK